MVLEEMMDLLGQMWCRIDGVDNIVMSFYCTKDGNRILAAMTRMDRGVIGWRIRQIRRRSFTSTAWQRLCLLSVFYNVLTVGLNLMTGIRDLGLHTLLPCFTASLASSLEFSVL